MPRRRPFQMSLGVLMLMIAVAAVWALNARILLDHFDPPAQARETRP
jgi:hypothetical protein